jgi:DNA adenine methylase
MRSIIKYYGGKHYIAKYLLEIIPKHNLYIEPFFGGGNMFFSKPPSKMEIINDLSDNIFSLYKVIADENKYKQLQHRLELTPYHAKFRDDYKQKLNEKLTIEDRAFYYLYVNRTSFNGVGGFSCTKLVRNNMIRSVSDYLSLIPHLEEIHNRLRNAVVENKDALELIQKYDDNDVFFYLDPPYIQSTRRSNQKYMIEMSDEDHERMINLILKSKAKIMLSGYDNEIYNNLVENGWNRLELESPNSCSDATEYVWINYDIPHDTKDIKEIFEINNNIISENNSKQLSLF